ncbi:CatB-related O-acetyltransferase [Psychroserpens jangbogonensis]|uniref:CatB-related O-acetyltransferase n=1 Tax=Psychroserpens jangbogonensis TaxID=1484460 RepID=UPI00068B363C|nr:CatB-related O-acetyltransferase [Psychroserpens jangbogonensis]
MSTKKKHILKDIFDSRMAVPNFKLVDMPLKNIVIFHDTKDHDSVKNLKDLENAVRFIEEDYDISFIEIASEKITINLLNNFDFIIVCGNMGSNIDKLLRSIKNLKIPKGIIIFNDNLVKNKKVINFYEVVWFFDFELAKQLKHPRKFHAFLGGDADHPKNIPNWDHKYYGYQIRKGLNSVVKDDTRISQRLYSDVRFKVGKDSFYNSKFQIIGKDTFVEIGSYCSLGNNVKLYTTNHDVNFASTQGYVYRKYFKTDHPGENQSNPTASRTKGPILIKNDVWIGDDVKIMSGVSIGNGACIAAGSIVTKNVGDYEIVGGAPARFLKYRFTENVITFFKEVKWWNWTDRKIKNNEHFFNINFNESINIKNFKIEA